MDQRFLISVGWNQDMAAFEGVHSYFVHQADPGRQFIDSRVHEYSGCTHIRPIRGRQLFSLLVERSYAIHHSIEVSAPANSLKCVFRGAIKGYGYVPCGIQQGLSDLVSNQVTPVGGHVEANAVLGRKIQLFNDCGGSKRLSRNGEFHSESVGKALHGDLSKGLDSEIPLRDGLEINVPSEAHETVKIASVCVADCQMYWHALAEGTTCSHVIEDPVSVFLPGDMIPRFAHISILASAYQGFAQE